VLGDLDVAERGARFRRWHVQSSPSVKRRA
jgi:hypothetical protein